MQTESPIVADFLTAPPATRRPAKHPARVRLVSGLEASKKPRDRAHFLKDRLTTSEPQTVDENKDAARCLRVFPEVQQPRTRRSVITAEKSASRAPGAAIVISGPPADIRPRPWAGWASASWNQRARDKRR